MILYTGAVRASLLRWTLTATLWTLAACAAPAPAPQERVLLAPEAQAGAAAPRHAPPELPSSLSSAKGLAPPGTRSSAKGAAAQESSRPAEIPTIGAETLRRKQAVKEPFLLLDVRPARNYATEHIAGAKNIPLDELSFNLHEIPRDLDVVCYCGGGACPLGGMAVERLRLKGYDRVFELEGGIEEWKRRGYPLH